MKLNTTVPHLTDSVMVDYFVHILNKMNCHVKRRLHGRSDSNNPIFLINEEKTFNDKDFYIDYFGDFYRILRRVNKYTSDIIGWHEVAFGVRGRLPFMFCVPYLYDPNKFDSDSPTVRIYNGKEPTGDPDKDLYFGSKEMQAKFHDLLVHNKYDDIVNFYGEVCRERRFVSALDRKWKDYLNWMFMGMFDLERGVVGITRNKETGKLNNVNASYLAGEPPWLQMLSNQVSVFCKTDNFSTIHDYQHAINSDYLQKLQSEYTKRWPLMKYGFVFQSLESVPAAIENSLVHRNYSKDDKSYTNITRFLKEHPMSKENLTLLDYLSSISSVSELSRFMTTRNDKHCSAASGTMYIDNYLGLELFKDNGLFTRAASAIRNIASSKKTCPELWKCVNDKTDNFYESYAFVKKLSRFYELFRKILFDSPDNIKFRAIRWNPDEIRNNIVFGIDIECSGHVYSCVIDNGRMNIVDAENKNSTDCATQGDVLRFLETISKNVDDEEFTINI